MSKLTVKDLHGANPYVWTQGPWEVLDHPTETCRIRAPHNGMEIGTVFCTDLEDGAANARLISAAPELYEALEALIRWSKIGNRDFEGTGDSHHMADEWVAARKALAKARGEK